MPTPARRAAPSSSEPSPSTKKACEEVAPVPGVGVGAGVGFVETPEAPRRGETAMGTGTGTGTAWAVRETDESMSAIFDSDFVGSCVTNKELWEVEAVGSPRVRAMT